jgi:hypothetical protein
MHDTTASADARRAAQTSVRLEKGRGNRPLQTVDDLLALDTLVASDGAENRIERAHSQCAMRGHRDPVG